MLRSAVIHFGRLVVGLIVVVLLLSSQAMAWTPGLKEAADAFALGKATPAQEMLLFYNNAEMNLLAQEGRISSTTYKTCQEEFFNLNEDFSHRAVRDAGFDASISNRKYNPGTDTDVNVLGKGGNKVTLDDIRKINGNYQNNVAEHFRRKGLNPPAGKLQTETDFMPHPKHTDPDEFQKIVQYVNQNGGTAYTDPRAASAQSKLGTPQPLSIDEASTFSSTMKDMADMKINKANALRTEARAIRNTNPGHAEYLEAQARQYDFQAAKYHNRIDAANNHLRRQHGLPENPRNITGFQQSADIIELSGRNPFTGKDAATIRNLHQNALQSSTDDMIDTLVDIARQNPSQAAQIQKALGREISRLPPNRAGQALDRIDRASKGIKGLEGSLARGATAEARLLQRMRQTDPRSIWTKDMGVVLKGVRVTLTVGSAYLMGSHGVSIALDNVEATDTLWDFFGKCYYHAAWEGTGIGPAFEQAQREELERFVKEYEAGQSPSMTKHVTLTLLKTGTYLGRDAIIGILYLPDTIWEYFTQEKELEGYAAMQNELARIMREIIKDQKDFDQVMANMKKMGLQDADAKPYLDCLCAKCGGSLGGFFNPGCKSDIGHGPCQCNGPLTIWKTPLPAGNKQAQYDCFNRVTRMRHDEAQAIFEKWRQQMVAENAQSVQPELEAIKQDINSRKVMEDEQTARNVSDLFAAIKDLLPPQEVDTVQASVGPSLENHAVKNLEAGNIDRAVDNQDRALNKVGPRNFEQQSHMTQRKAQYEKWAEKWRETKNTKFREIDELVRKKQTQQARSEIEVLEYRMLKDPARPLPPAIKDPAFLALKERVTALGKRHEQAMQEMWAKVRPLGADREHRLAIPILEKALEEWEHSPLARQDLERQLGYHRAELKRAEDKKKLGQNHERNGNPGDAVREYEESLRIQKDAALERKLASLKKAVQNQAKTTTPTPTPSPAAAPAAAPTPATTPAPVASTPVQASPARTPDTPSDGCRCEDWDHDGRFGVVLSGNVLRSNIGPYEACMRYLESLGQCSVTGKTATGSQPGSTVAPQASTSHPGAAVSGKGGDMSDWTVNFGIAELAYGWIATDPPSEGKTSYFIAPASLLGDWSGYSGLSFEKKSSGGTYQDPYSYEGDGDIVIESSRGTARFTIEPDHSGNWRQYSIDFSEKGWSVSGSAQTMAELLGDVTGFRIRAEYGAGKDYSALREFRLKQAAQNPVAMPAAATASTNMLGTWDHVGNGHRTQLIVKNQQGQAFSGVMHGDPLINGVVDGNTVTFTRDIPQRQDYSGTVTQSPDGSLTMRGTFTQKGITGTYGWSSRKSDAFPQSANPENSARGGASSR